MATNSLEPTARIDPVKLRSWWWHRQGLDGRLAGSTSDAILAATGWARSVGGANPYLQLFSRGGISREQADRDLAEQRIHELPSARGCTYVLPQNHYAIGLLVGQGQSDEAAISAAVRHLDVTEAEISGLMEGVQDALESGPLDPKALKDALGDRVRNLGEAGKKRGITTTLPLALGRLQSHGLIRRLPIGGRIDQQRYAYGLWRPSPLEGVSLTREQALEELARIYWQ